MSAAAEPRPAPSDSAGPSGAPAPSSDPGPSRGTRVVAAVDLVVIVLGIALAVFAAVHWVTGSQQWLRILVWFALALVAHDLVVFPVYAGLDRVLGRVLPGVPRRTPGPRAVPLLNHVRAPALGSLLLLVVFLPEISGQADGGFRYASGLEPADHGLVWLLVSAALFALSAAVYAVRVLRAGARPRT